MDGGPRQKEMATMLKRQVKVQANHRRERKYLQNFEPGPSAPDFDDSASDSGDISGPASADGSSRAGGATTSPSTSHDTPPDSSAAAFRFDAVKTSIADVAATPAAAPAAAPAPTPGGEGHPWESDQDNDENEMNTVMIYFDHVFPFLFPFYRPSLLEGGRGWLLSLLRANKAVYHTGLSLSSYFASVIISAAEGYSGPCQDRARTRLQEQQSLALRELQSDMTAIVTRGPGENLKDRIRVLNSIIHLLVFDVSVTHSGQWCIHMKAAISLFQQIIPSASLWQERIQQLGYIPGKPMPQGRTIPWSTEQAAMRTFGGALFLIDTLAATAGERRPLLLDYHATALDLEHTRDPAADNRSRIRFEDLFGMETWVVHVVGEIAALDAWKKESRRSGTLSMTQLVSRAAVLQQALTDGIACLEGRCPILASLDDGCCSPVPRPHPLHHHNPSSASKPDTLALYGRFTAADNECIVPIYTKIWAYGALAYLSVVVSGWQPSCPEVAAPATAARALLDALPMPACTRIVAWPWFIVGCLSPPHERYKFRDLLPQMGSLGVFCSVTPALAAMEIVWARGDVQDDQWDFASCMQTLGHPILIL
ncbi:fungal-specific transcription factor domain-containing protein [Plectosphaerella cucumerina]|uniref:Fungal-specific transcription factor domain-containing protein n=1 Tax=Plectosphaerella cucumerina TaxID=40658 RepID=A0A8K0X493_9PEZI|nr:fungal-specific transcription factor domain-containing protein [Plectosphaerella cucumerina]